MRKRRKLTSKERHKKLSTKRHSQSLKRKAFRAKVTKDDRRWGRFFNRMKDHYTRENAREAAEKPKRKPRKVLKVVKGAGAHKEV